MDPKKFPKYGIGCIIGDCILLIDCIVRICKGEVTAIDFLGQLALVLLVSIPLILWIRSRRRK